MEEPLVMFRFLLPVLLLFLCCSCGLIPQGPSLRTPEDFRRAFPSEPAVIPSGRPLSLEDVEKIALANNPDLHAAHYSVKAARYRWYAALSGYLPRLTADFGVGQSFDSTYDRRTPPADVLRREDVFGTAAGLSVSYLIFDGFEREFNALAAKQDVLAEQEMLMNVRRLLLRAAAYAFYDCISSAEMIRIYEADRAFQDSALEQAEVRYAFGSVPLDNVLNFRILRTSAESKLLDARYQCETARFALCAIMGMGEDFRIPECREEPEEKDGMELYFPDESSCIAEAVRQRPDLEAARRRLEAARLRKFAAYSGFLPSLSAYANFGFSTHAARTAGLDSPRYYYNEGSFDYGIRSRWELFSGFSTVQLVRERTAAQQILFFQIRETYLQLVREVRSALADCRNAAAQVKLHREMALWSRRQRDLVADEYEAGKETVTRLNQAQSEFVSSEARYVVARAKLGRARARLQAALGRD